MAQAGGMLKEAEAETSHSGMARVPREMTAEQKAKMACQKIRLGEVSRETRKRLSKTFRTGALKQWGDHCHQKCWSSCRTDLSDWTELFFWRA